MSSELDAIRARAESITTYGTAEAMDVHRRAMRRGLGGMRARRWLRRRIGCTCTRSCASPCWERYAVEPIPCPCGCHGVEPAEARITTARVLYDLRDYCDGWIAARRG